MSGREDMSSYWCMWCMLHSSEWRTFCDNCDSIPDEEKNMDTGATIRYLAHIQNNNIKQPKEIKDIVSEHVWDFIKPSTTFSCSYTLKLVLSTWCWIIFMHFLKNKQSVVTRGKDST
jgi:hypothetical protein